MKLLFILNDPPYGTERCYNALRLAHALGKAESTNEITIFLMADAVGCAKRGQSGKKATRPSTTASAIATAP